MLDYWCEYNDSGITVPYAPYRGQGRSNRGFTDLRGRPDLAAQVAEVQDSSAFKALIIQLAQPYSQLFSVGCDLGTRAANRGERWPRPFGQVGGLNKLIPVHDHAANAMTDILSGACPGEDVGAI